MASLRKRGRFGTTVSPTRMVSSVSPRVAPTAERPRNWPAPPSQRSPGSRPDDRPEGRTNAWKPAVPSGTMSPSSSLAWNRRGTTPKHVAPPRATSSALSSWRDRADFRPGPFQGVTQAVGRCSRPSGLSGPRNLNAYTTAIKSFSRWLTDGRTSDYSLATLAKLNEQADRRRVRRALTPEEAARVVQAAETGPEAGD